MAQRVDVVLVDDLDGGEASRTVTFALDGASYEIDLSEQNATNLKAALEPFVRAGRKVPRARRTARARRTTSRDR